MEDTNVKNNVESAEANGASEDKDSKRSVYPTRSLNYMISFVSKVYTELGANIYHSKEDISKIHNLSVSTIKPLLSTAQQYGLLELKHGTGYMVTKLFTKIFRPLDDNEKRQGVVDSLRSSQIYSQLLGEYNNRVFPSANGLVNVLVRSHGMNDGIAQKMVEILFENLKTYNLLNSSSVLSLDTKTSHPHKEPEKKHEEPIKIENDKPSDKQTGIIAIDEEPDNGMIKIPIRLKGKRMAYLSFPSEYDDQDLTRIEKVIKAYVDIYNEKDDDVG